MDKSNFVYSDFNSETINCLTKTFSSKNTNEIRKAEMRLKELGKYYNKSFDRKRHC